MGRAHTGGRADDARAAADGRGPPRPRRRGLRGGLRCNRMFIAMQRATINMRMQRMMTPTMQWFINVPQVDDAAAIKRRNPATQHYVSARSQQHGNRGVLKHGVLTRYSRGTHRVALPPSGPVPCRAVPCLAAAVGLARARDTHGYSTGYSMGYSTGYSTDTQWGTHAVAARVRPVDRSGDERHVPPRLHAAAARRAVSTPSSTPVSTKPFELGL
jgi:hypothetical protein